MELHTMKHTCDICGEEFDGWPSPNPWLSGQFDEVYIRRRYPNEQKTSIVSFKCCPYCVELAWTYFESLLACFGRKRKERT